MSNEEMAEKENNVGELREEQAALEKRRRRVEGVVEVPREQAAIAQSPTIRARRGQAQREERKEREQNSQSDEL